MKYHGREHSRKPSRFWDIFITAALVGLIALALSDWLV